MTDFLNPYNLEGAWYSLHRYPNDNFNEYKMSDFASKWGKLTEEQQSAVNELFKAATNSTFDEFLEVAREELN